MLRVLCCCVLPLGFGLLGCDELASEGEGEGEGEPAEGEGELPTGRPVVSNLVVSNITERSARVTFTTDLPATTFLKVAETEDGVANAGFLDVSVDFPDVNHGVNLSLEASTTYFFVAVAFNDEGLSTESPLQSFTTLAPNVPPVISDVAVTNITVEGATISWTTDEPATGDVSVTGIDIIDMVITETGPLSTSHSVNVSGLTCGNTYRYDVSATDADGGSSITDTATFDTPRRTLYVDAGAAAGGDGSLAAPFVRIQDAINAANSDTDAIFVAAGTYNEDVTVDGDTDHDGVITFSDIDYTGLELRGGFNADFSAFEGRSIVQGQGTQQEPGGTTALRLLNFADIILRDFEIRGYDGLGDAPDVARVTGVEVTSADPTIDRVVIRGGVAVANDTAVSTGLTANGQSLLVMTNSLVTSGRAGRQGLLGLADATNVAATIAILDINASLALANNTIIVQDAKSVLLGSTSRGLSFGDPAEGSGAVLVTNCIFARDGVTSSVVDMIAYRTPGFTVTELSNNLFVGGGDLMFDFASQVAVKNTNGDASFSEADALQDGTHFLLVENNRAAAQNDDVFTDAAAGDFSLVSGSAAVDAGKDHTGEVYASVTDINGQPRRGAVDIGAFELP